MITVLLVINITLMYSAPLIFAALGGVISEKSGVINLALEGIMTVGALAGVVIAFKTGNPWLGFFASGFFGALLALLHAIACVSFKADQTISGIALNFIGPGLALFVCRLMFDGATMTPPVPLKMPKILTLFSIDSNSSIFINLNYDSTVIIAFLFTAVMCFFLYRTKWGLRVTAVGEHPVAADTLGINVSKVRYACVIASGFLAGLGGGACSLAIVSLFSPPIISGRGFIALAAVIFGKWTPHGALAACLLFGFAQALVVLLGGTESGIPTQLISMLPYILTLVVLVLFVGKAVAPRASGIPYEKNQR